MNAVTSFDRFVEQSPGSVLKAMVMLNAVGNAPTHMQARHLADKLLELANRPTMRRLHGDDGDVARAIAGGLYGLADRIEAERAPTQREKPGIVRQFCAKATRLLK